MDVEQVVARLGEIFDADEAEIASDLIRRLHGTIPDSQLLQEIGLAVAIHRRQLHR